MLRWEDVPASLRYTYKINIQAQGRVIDSTANICSYDRSFESQVRTHAKYLETSWLIFIHAGCHTKIVRYAGMEHARLSDI
jgi:hypothetical protein